MLQDLGRILLRKHKEWLESYIFSLPLKLVFPNLVLTKQTVTTLQIFLFDDFETFLVFQFR